MRALRKTVVLVGVVGVCAAVLLGLGLDSALAAAGPGPAPAGGGLSDRAVFALAAAAVIAVSCWSAAYAVARVGSAALGAASENPELLGRSLVFVGLAEGIAVLGLIVAIMLLGKI